MKDLVAIAERIAERLVARHETIAVAESSTGGLISASLLAVPGASAYFLGSAVVYTRDARRILVGIADDQMKAIRPARNHMPDCWPTGFASASPLFGVCPRPAQQGPPATDMAMRPATPAWLFPARNRL